MYVVVNREIEGCPSFRIHRGTRNGNGDHNSIEIYRLRLSVRTDCCHGTTAFVTYDDSHGRPEVVRHPHPRIAPRTVPPTYRQRPVPAERDCPTNSVRQLADVGTLRGLSLSEKTMWGSLPDDEGVIAGTRVTPNLIGCGCRSLPSHSREGV